MLIYDGGDIDDSGHWCGKPVGCLTCHETRPIRADIINRWEWGLICGGGCGEVFAKERA